ncbi:MAG: sodium:proton antiporter, partial [Myxococcota bacterium]|nr:sodium:proton antiporter [Myxococcota bacterium]
MTDPTFLSCLPALVAIGLAFATRQVLPALFLGIVTGSAVLWWTTGDPADANFISRFLLPALGTKSYAKILIIYLWCLGGLIGLWERTGGALHFAKVVGGRFAKSDRSSLVFAWVLGCVFHQGGTVSTVLAGTTVRPVSDKHRVSHEELAYVVDSTASPIATLLPFNAWPGFVAALVAGTVVVLPDEVAGMKFFFASVPFNFYAMFAVLFTLLLGLGWLPWLGRSMTEARRRSREDGLLDAPDARPMLPEDDAMTAGPSSGYQPSLWDFFLPIGVLMVLAVVPYVVFDSDWINEAFLACSLSAMGVAVFRGMSVTEALDGFVAGCGKMTIGAIILGLAVTLGYVAKELHTADYLVGIMAGHIPLMALPVLLTTLCMSIA